MSIFRTTVASEIEIEAPLQVVWEVLTDLRGWPRWNPFVVEVRGATRPSRGVQVRLDVRWADGTGLWTDEMVTQVDEAPDRKAFSWCFASLLARMRLVCAERTMSVQVLGAGRCRYRSEEHFHGPMVPFLPSAAVLDGFERMGAALKLESERVASLGGEPEAPPATPVVPRSSVPELGGGLPFLGHVVALALDPLALYRRAAREAGPVCWIDGGFGIRSICCTDPEGFDLFKNKSTSTSFLHDIERIDELLGGSVLPLDGSAHRRARSALNGPFLPRGLADAGVGAIVAKLIERRVESFRGRRGVQVLVELRELTLEIILRIVGIEASDLSAWRKSYERAALLAINFPIDAPGTPRRIGREARQWLHRELIAVISAARLRENDPSMLGALVRARAEDGTALGDGELADNLIFLLLAGHETSASTMTWMVAFLAARPDVWAELRRESLAAADLPRSPKDLRDFPYAEAIFRETLRLYPPVSVTARKATSDFELAGHLVREGTLLTIPIVHLSRHPDIHPDPDEFRPERWLGKSGSPTPLELVQFGGGPHFCLGYHLAWMEGVQFAVAMGRLLPEAGPRLDGPFPAARYLPFVHPSASTRLRFDTA